jgi:hypothetical protein
MSKFIMVALLVASLIAGATPVMAQPVLQGGIGDPLTLAASGVVVPFITVLRGSTCGVDPPGRIACLR